MKHINLKHLMALRAKKTEAQAILGRAHIYLTESQIAMYKERIAAADEGMKPTMDKISAIIADVQGKSTARTISVYDIIYNLERVENTLGITKKAMDGIKVDVDIHAQAFPGAYKGIPMSTQFKATYSNGSWRLTDICRSNCRRSPSIIIYHTEASKAALIERFSKM